MRNVPTILASDEDGQCGRGAQKYRRVAPVANTTVPMTAINAICTHAVAQDTLHAYINPVTQFFYVPLGYGTFEFMKEAREWRLGWIYGSTFVTLVYMNSPRC